MRNRGSVSALSAGAYTTTLHVIVDRVKGGGRAPSPSLWDVRKKWSLPLCVYSVENFFFIKAQNRSQKNNRSYVNLNWLILQGRATAMLRPVP
jgi:hypothetical protein